MRKNLRTIVRGAALGFTVMTLLAAGPGARAGRSGAEDELRIQDLTIVAEKGVSPEEMKGALVVASSNINWPNSVTQGNAPNVYTNANNPFSVTAGSIPNGMTRGNFPDTYTIGSFREGDGGVAIPMPNTNL